MDDTTPRAEADEPALPAELRGLDEQLRADGVTWRRQLATLASAEAGTGAGAAQAVPEDIGGLDDRAADTSVPRQTAADAPARHVRPRQSLRVPHGLPAAAAMLAVVLLTAALLHALAPRRAVTPTPTVTPRVRATPPLPTATIPTGQWVPLSGLDGASGDPVIAPVAPQTVYEVTGLQPGFDATHAALRKTTDLGRTWESLPIPLPFGTLRDFGSFNVLVDPVDPSIVFLGVEQAYPKTCPTWPTASQTPQAFASGALLAGFTGCSWLYRSGDGGHHWRQVNLPVGGFLAPAVGNQVRSANTVIVAQGGKLFAYDRPDVYRGVTDRLVVSDDGGVTWHTADDALAAQHQQVWDFAADPHGSAVFAVTSPDFGDPPYALWGSDDAGASWSRIGTLPVSTYAGIQVGRSPGGATWLYLSGSTQGAVPDAGSVWCSTDGGQTWGGVPGRGLPPPAFPSQELSLQGVLSSGAVIATGQAVGGPTQMSFFSWQPGATSWTQLTPPLFTVYLLLVSPAGPDGPESLWSASGGPDETIARYALP